MIWKHEQTGVLVFFAENGMYFFLRPEIVLLRIAHVWFRGCNIAPALCRFLVKFPHSNWEIQSSAGKWISKKPHIFFGYLFCNIFEMSFVVIRCFRIIASSLKWSEKCLPNLRTTAHGDFVHIHKELASFRCDVIFPNLQKKKIYWGVKLFCSVPFVQKMSIR